MTNKPEAHEIWDLQGKPKMTYEKDSKLPNAGTFRIEKEDHTLGNMIRMQLLEDPTVLFAGYKIEHPLDQHMLLKVQTTKANNPVQALTQALDALVTETSLIEERFDKVVQSTRAERGELPQY